jgi:lysophospholipase L1-like esterase
LFISLLSLVFFVVLAEGIVRLAKPDLTIPQAGSRFRFQPLGHQGQIYHERDPVLGWRLKRDSRVSVEVGEGPAKQRAVLTTNGHGFRGPEFREEKPEGVTRIVFAGDSNAMGYGVTDDAIYSVGVAAFLSRLVPAARFESINLGVDGYSSHQVRALLADYLPRLRPDILCVQVGFNDHCLADMPDSSRVFDRHALLDFAEKFDSYRWLRRRVLSARGARTDAPVTDPVPRVSVDAFEANIRAIVEACEARGTRLILVATAAKPDVPLVVNEVPFQADSTIVWMTQRRWLDEQLRRAGLAVDPPSMDAAYERVLRAAVAVGPEFPLPYFALWDYLRQTARPDSIELAVLDAAWRERDVERVFFSAYMERLREVCRRENVEFVDVANVVSRDAGRSPADHYLDFVHLNEPGQVAMARVLTQVIGRRLGSP